MQLPRAQRGPMVYNLNTYVLVAGFVMTIAGGLIAWGYVAAEVRSGLASHDIDIERLEKRVTSVEAVVRQLDNHELRITNVERRASEAADAMRTVEAAINSLASDIRVTREIVQRIEQAQSNSRAPPN